MSDLVRISDANLAELQRSFGRGDPTLGQCVEVLHVLDEVTAARSLLRRIEWCDEGYECHICRGSMPVDPKIHGEEYAAVVNRRAGHEPDCELAALIGKAQ